MNVEYPALLWLLLLLVPLAAYLWHGLKHSDARHDYAHLPLLEGLPHSERQRFFWLPTALQLLAVASVIVAVAQPYKLDTVHSDQAQGIAIALVVDISTSMHINMDNASDASEQRISRMEGAKRVLQEFVLGDGETHFGRPNDLISVITFARYPDTLVPLTTSHRALAAIAADIEPEHRPGEDGTAYGDAVALAAAQLSQYEEILKLEADSIKNKIVILLTDGENNAGDYSPLMAASMAAEWGIKVYTISLSDPILSEIDSAQGTLRLSDATSAADIELQTMADATGGTFQRAHDYESLNTVYHAIDALETSQLQTVLFEDRIPHFQFAALLALLSLVLSALLSATWLRSNG
ncbi:VWA domain-containing protein [Ferrimonas pelagia]|uniref:VWA domain-containing protein n=1 Tax=Ferrimonas pelagia TaxID=1177826 RepID=A0ABP9EJT3_9GAMM